MKLLWTFLRLYRWQSVAMLAAFLLAGVAEGVSLSALLPLLGLVAEGAHFIATNPDPVGPSESGIVPACGAMAALIEKATGVSPFFVGKPNPLMMRNALKKINVQREEAIIIGDRMDTDIVGAVSSGMQTILVLTGVTQRDEVDRFPYRSTEIINSIADVDP